MTAFSAGVGKWAARSSDSSGMREGRAGEFATPASLIVIVDSGSSQERTGCYFD